MLKGTLADDRTGQPSYARIMGVVMVTTMVALAVGQFVALLLVDLCNPVIASGQVVLHDGEIIETCVKRLDAGAQAAWSTATGGTLTVAIGWLYRENKRAEVANGA
jgi:hypothetical protein